MSLFHIPETTEEKQELIKDIIKRNAGTPAGIEIMYVVALVEALYCE